MAGIAARGDVRLIVRLLGRIEVATADGRPVRLSGRHAQALFALLVLTRRPRSRDVIAAELWPESDGASSAGLRQALWLVRSGLSSAGLDPDSVLEVEPDTLGVRLEALAEIDVAAFEECARRMGCTDEMAISLYRGDLVEGLGHECFASERERLSDLYEDALASGAEKRLVAGDLDGARTAAEDLLARDPLREEAHAILIAVHGLLGSRSQVVRRYRRLQAILARELDVAPLPETEATYRLAIARTLARSHERASAIDPPQSTVLVAIGS
jgi:DNA-binding SARP family transcriptional activator